MEAVLMPRKKQTPKSRKFRLYLIITLCCVAVVLFFINGPRGTLQYFKAYKEKQQLEKEIEALEAEKLKLIEEKKKLETDPEYIEKYARERYTMKKKGEKVYKIQHEKK